MRSLKFVAPGIVLMLTTCLQAGETVSHPQLGLRLSVPDGFVEAPDRVRGNIVTAFQRPPTGEQKLGTFVVVSRLGGVLGREKIDLLDLTSTNPQITLTSETWKGFDLEVVRVPEQAGDLRALTFEAQIPLKPEAVQVTVVGEAGREDELRGVLRSVLSNLDGQTNWLNSQERNTRLGEGIAQILVPIGVLVVIGIVVWRAARRRGKADGQAEPGDAANRGGV